MHRRLPHLQFQDAAYFLTWRLHGSLPSHAVADLLTSDGAKFVRTDRLLDAAPTGPKWLAEPNVAEAVIEVLLHGHKGKYELGPWVLMPNHIHLILKPNGDLPAEVAAIKTNTARKANRVLNRRGAFWAQNYFDRRIRDRNAEQRIANYIEQNPVKAGLCAEPEAWPFSSTTRTHT